MYRFLKRKTPAGMTVEASIVLPLFLFFFLNLGSAMEMIRLHGNLQLGLWDVGNRMCVYGYAVGSGGKASDTDSKTLKQEDREWWQEWGDIALSYTYIKSQVVNYVGEEYLEESPLSYGVSGLQFWESDVLQSKAVSASEDVLDIVMTYQVAPWLEIPFVRPFRMVNRYYGRMWTGYDLSGGASGGDSAQDVVYITENASVYHESINCTHLKLSIREVSMEEALAARNENGGRYTECAKCKKKAFQGTVFIGREGDCYHYDRDCSGLKRTIYTIPRQQASRYRPCSRCGYAK
ncbi:MAG: hypothetical protein NC092_07125 [Butyrivibrio sp.]|nr:hypothetical protein [Butyrivibrio sp.]